MAIDPAAAGTPPAGTPPAGQAAGDQADDTQDAGQQQGPPTASQLSQLRAEVASMAILAASRILGKEVDAKAHQALIERSLDEAGVELGKTN